MKILMTSSMIAGAAVCARLDVLKRLCFPRRVAHTRLVPAGNKAVHVSRSIHCSESRNLLSAYYLYLQRNFRQEVDWQFWSEDCREPLQTLGSRLLKARRTSKQVIVPQKGSHTSYTSCSQGRDMDPRSHPEFFRPARVLIALDDQTHHPQR
jgi:hypothetical protein